MLQLHLKVFASACMCPLKHSADPTELHGELNNAKNLHNEHRQAEKTPWSELVFVDVA